MNPQRPYPMPEPGGPWGLPTALALGVHALLVVALTWGVSWKQTPEPVLDAELWSALPQVAAPARVEPPVEPPVEAEVEPQPEPEAEPEPAPPAPPPPPPPVKAPTQTKADIAAQKKVQDERKAKELAAKDKLAKEKAAKDKAAKDKAAKDQLAKKKQAEDKAKKDKLAKEKAAKEKVAKEKAEMAEKAAKAKAAADAQRREAQRKEQIDRMMGQAGGKGQSGGTAAANSGPSANYGGLVAASIKPNVVLADPVVGNPRAEVEVRADADGKITSRRLVKSSGNAAWDQAVLRAIDRTGTLPRDTDGRVPSALIIGLRPQD